MALINCGTICRSNCLIGNAPVQHSTAQQCNALNSTALHCTALHSTGLHTTAWQCTALHNTETHSITLLLHVTKCNGSISIRSACLKAYLTLLRQHSIFDRQTQLRVCQSINIARPWLNWQTKQGGYSSGIMSLSHGHSSIPSIKRQQSRGNATGCTFFKTT